MRGNALIGPHEAGAAAFFPPGVWSNTPEDFPKSRTNEGWRHGVWEPLTEIEIFIRDQQGYPVDGPSEHVIWVTGKERPITLEALSLRAAVQTVSLIPSLEAKAFVGNETARQGAYIERQMRLNHDRSYHSQLSTELEELQLEAATVFGDEWVRRNLVFTKDRQGGVN